MATYAEPMIERRTVSRRAESRDAYNPRYLVPVGRALFAAIFIISGFGHFSSTLIGHAAQQGLPLANILVPLSGLVAIAGGVSILLGYHARLGAWLLVAFLIPVSVVMHNFWTVTDPAARAIQQGMFMKNVAMLGGALLIAFFGSGPMSVDRRRKAA